MPSKRFYILSILAIVCALGITFFPAPLLPYVCHKLPHNMTIRICNTRTPVNTTAVQVFSSLADLARHFPNFNPLIIDLYDMRSVLRDADMQVRHSELSVSCKKDIVLMVDAIRQTINEIIAAMEELNVQSPHVIYKFIQYNTKLQAAGDVSAVLKPLLFSLIVRLRELAQYAHQLDARYIPFSISSTVLCESIFFRY
jgi:hypothetical protein